LKHVVGFSGGIDSQAMALWVRQRFPVEDVILCNADPGGNEHPVTSEFIEWYRENVFPVVVIHPQVRDMAGGATAQIAKRGLAQDEPLTFDLMASLKGLFPSTKARFCTTYMKLEPMRRWCYDNGAKGLHFEPETGKIIHARLAGPDAIPSPEGILSDGYERYAGIRRDESKDRIDAAEREYDDLFACWLNRPLVTWTKDRCFETVIEAGESFNPLYLQGFNRVGCAPCINARKEDINLWAARYPEMIYKIRRWETRVGRTFFPPIMPTGVKAVRDEGETDKAFNKRKRSLSRRHGWIDEVVDWSKTVHGGKQFGLPMLEADVASGMCMSNYGLCE
jgi:3'-phosphoadenosine 5'-phosphosulfate sulfotransferase (PAPS reductase)/FAD synthetase